MRQYLFFIALPIFCFFVCLPASFGRDTREDPGIVVWKLEAKQGVSDAEIDSLSGIISAETYLASGRRVISEADIRTILAGEQKRQECGGDGTLCIAEIGNALGVPEVVAGDLGRVGEVWILNLRRIDVLRVRVIARASKRVKGDLTAIVDAIPQTVAQLFAVEYSWGLEVRDEVPRRDVGDIHSRIGSWFKTESFLSMATWGWTATGTGIGMFVLGAVATGMAKAEADNYSHGDRGARDANRVWTDTMIAGYTIGTVLVATGAFLLIMDALDEDPGQPSVRFGPAFDRNTFKVMLEGRW